MNPRCIRWLLILLTAWGVSPVSAKRPLNVLFLFSDDQRFDTIHALGNREIQTPNLDRLVREGFAFTHAHIMGSMHGAVCMPSRAMVMTGRTLFRATRTPHTGNLATNLVLFPQAFQPAGYETIGIGKWHNDREAYRRSFTAGGPIFFGGMSSHTQVPVFDFDPTGRYPANKRRVSNTFSSVLFADAAIEFLREPRDQPFFLYVAFTAPHDPRTPPQAYANRYPPDAMPLPENFLPEHPFDNGELRIRDEKLLPWPRTMPAVRREIALYYAMITHLDAQIGRILEALDASGQARDTLIIFAGDNGLAVGQHGLLGKQNLYDPSVRVPLIFRGPGVRKGKTSQALCYLFDVFPTVCDLSSVSIPETVEGKSLAPIMRGKAGKVRDTVFGAYRDVQRMVRDDRWKLIYYPTANRLQLFDLQADPLEMNDLSTDPQHAHKRDALRARLTDLQLELADPMLQSPVQSAQIRRQPSRVR